MKFWIIFQILVMRFVCWLDVTIAQSDGRDAVTSASSTTSNTPTVSNSVFNRTVTPSTRPTTTTAHSPPRLQLSVTLLKNYTDLSETSGSVTPSFFTIPLNSTTFPRPPHASVYVIVPADHVVMVSFPEFRLPGGPDSSHCHNTTVTLYEVDQNSNIRVWQSCGFHTLGIPPRVFNKSLRLDFDVSQPFWNASETGFKMLFTILPKSQEPQVMRSGLFDCDVPHFEKFRRHFSCNFVQECQNFEDERDCSYTTEECGVGFIDLSDRCVSFPKLKTDVTWYDVYKECDSQGMNLLTFRTEQEWSTVLSELLNLKKVNERIYVGLRTAHVTEANVPGMYKQRLQWADNTMAYYVRFNTTFKYSSPTCAFLFDTRLATESCYDGSNTTTFYCERKKRITQRSSVTFPSINATQRISSNNMSVVTCPGGHVTLDFLSCDPTTDCGVEQFQESCETSAGLVVPQFQCERGAVNVHYSMVCDHKSDCPDNSDETYCEFPPCDKTYSCYNKQCISTHKRCDKVEDCLDGSDENNCFAKYDTDTLKDYFKPPAVLDINKMGRIYGIKHINEATPCPVTHFRCPENYCMPVYLRCNGVLDCLGGEDERNCDSYTCPGFYRCRHHRICLHLSHVCDGIQQCPESEDELFCDQPCPTECRCQGFAFVCMQAFQASSYPQIRYLDASHSGMDLIQLNSHEYLIRLVLRNCNLRTVPNMTLSNLRHLDLRDNKLTHVDIHSFLSLRNLNFLSLSNNPLTTLGSFDSSGNVHCKLKSLDLSFTNIEVYDSSLLRHFHELETLNLSHSALHTITQNGFNSTPELERLYLHGAPLENYPHYMLKPLKSLMFVQTDDYKLCCDAMLPEQFHGGEECITEMDDIASCSDLLRENIYRGFLWLFALLAVLGNAGSFATRFYLCRKNSGQSSFNVFVTNLCVADFLMGVYLTIIGIADEVYRGTYVLFDEEWKGSLACRVAGFLSLLSSEVSAFNICLITVDRFLVLRFPFSRVRFGKHSATAACLVAWLIGFCLAAVPLLPMTSDWEFYSQTGICIPLPINRTQFKGSSYSFGVMIVLNFVLFLFIAVGQAFIFQAIRSNSLTTSKTGNCRDATIARRLTTIVLSDFLCWFPICVLGLMAKVGTPVSGDVNVGIAIFVLPFNSALNPFLYTFNIIMEKQRRAQKAKLMKRLEAKMLSITHEAEMKSNALSKPTKESALEQIKKWLDESLITASDLTSRMELWDNMNQDGGH